VSTLENGAFPQKVCAEENKADLAELADDPVVCRPRARKIAVEPPPGETSVGDGRGEAADTGRNCSECSSMVAGKDLQLGRLALGKMLTQQYGRWE